MSAADVLERAATLIEERGLNQDGSYYNKAEWRRGEREPRDCRLCTVGALLVAAGAEPFTAFLTGPEHQDFRTAIELVSGELERRGVQEYVASWSDDLDDPAEAIALLRAVAAAA